METRREIIFKGAEECLKTLYKYSVPSLSYEELLEKAKNKELFDEEFWNHHYLPDELLKEIIECYKSAYGIQNYFQDYANVVKDYLLKGGKKEITINDDSYVGYHREIVDVGPVSDFIGEENAKAVEEQINECLSFYKFDTYENHMFDWEVFGKAPTCNPRTVEEYWKDIKIDAEKIKANFYKEEYGEE